MCRVLIFHVEVTWVPFHVESMGNGLCTTPFTIHLASSGAFANLSAVSRMENAEILVNFEMAKLNRCSCANSVLQPLLHSFVDVLDGSVGTLQVLFTEFVDFLASVPDKVSLPHYAYRQVGSVLLGW